LVCALAGVAYSGAVKSKNLLCVGPGDDLNPYVDGKIIMNYHDSSSARTEVQITAKGLEPNVTYGVQVMPGFSDALAFTTSASGNGAYHNTVLFDITTLDPKVKIFVWDGDPYTIDEVSYEEVRAYGCLSGECAFDVLCETDADCDSGFACLRDTCEGGYCFHARRDGDCDDGDHCTADFCIGVDEYGNTLCEHTPIWDPDQGCNPF
jgi:hypothetical protein